MHVRARTMGGWLVAAAALGAALPATADEWDDLLGADALGRIAAALPAKVPAQAAKPRKVLVFADSKRTFDCMALEEWQKPVPHKSAPYAAKAMALMGERTGAFAARIEADPAVFREDLRPFDAIVLANVFLEGKLFRSPRDVAAKEENRFAQQQKALLDYVRGGGGLVGIHVAAAEAAGWPEFNRMLGATYAGQAWQAFHKAPLKVDDPQSPLTAAFAAEGFSVADDIYMFREPGLRAAVRVLVSVDTSKAPASMWADRPDGDYPVSWIRKHGEGRVFYTALGHEPEMYLNQAFLAHVLAGVQFAAGDLPADTAPSKALPPAKDAEKMAGWTALFDGKDLSAFDADEEQKKHWIVSDGLLRYDGRGKTLRTKEPLADNYQLRVDWRMPRAADSGILLGRGTSGQLNIWGLEVGSGQLFSVDVFSPTMNADKPLGEWNTLLLTVKDGLRLEINGREVLVTRERRGIAGPGIGLQQDGDTIEWKNIYVRRSSGEAGR